jgi:mRNA interferase RelE/StbE
MKKYTIEFDRRAVKELQSISARDQSKIREKINHLAENPRPHGAEKLSGEDNLYRIRQGDYRVVYSIFDQTLKILVVRIGDRKEVYKKL